MFKNYLPALVLLLCVVNRHHPRLNPEVIAFYNENVTPSNINKAVVFRVSKLLCNYKEVKDNPELSERVKLTQLTLLAKQIDQLVSEYLAIYWYQYASTELANKNLGSTEDISKLIWIRHQCRKVLALQAAAAREENLDLPRLLEDISL